MPTPATSSCRPCTPVFTGFGNLTGGTDADSFCFLSGGSLSGNLNGGGGADSLDYNTDFYDSAVTVVLSTASSGTATGIAGTFSNIETVIGQASFAATNSLTGYNTAKVWTATGANAGNIDDVFFYRNFGTTLGGSGNQAYEIGNNNLPSGPINGGSGNNVLDLSAWSGTLTWHITSDNAGTVTTPAGSFSFTQISRIIGGSGNDAFIFSDGAILTEGLDGGGGGENSLDMSQYTTQNVWTGGLPAGTITTAQGSFNYSDIQDVVAGKVTTLKFAMYDLTGTITQMNLPAVMPQGGSGNITVSVLSKSNVRLTATINVNFYLSTTDSVAGATLIGQATGVSIDLMPGQTKSVSVNAVVPANGITAGTYNVLAVIDSGNAVTEADKINNTVVAPQTVQIVTPTENLTGAFTSMTLPATNVLPGTKGSVTLLVSNSGNVEVTSPIAIAFYLSPDTTIDQGETPFYVATNWVTNIGPGSSKTYNGTLTIPTSTPVGTYYVLAKVDANSQVPELNTNDKVRTRRRPSRSPAPWLTWPSLRARRSTCPAPPSPATAAPSALPSSTRATWPPAARSRSRSTPPSTRPSTRTPSRWPRWPTPRSPWPPARPTPTPCP